MSTVKEPLKWLKAFHFKDGNPAFQMAWGLGQVYDRQGDIAEILETNFRIKEGDVESWYVEWLETADRVWKIAVECEKEGHNISAGEAYQRASNYYRMSEFYLHEDPSDQRALGAAEKAVTCFKKAMVLLSIPVEFIKIPYEDTTLPGYFYTSPIVEKKAPVLIVQTGFDGTAEELYGTANAAIKRGYHCLIFEGPGQGQVIRKQNLAFRHDWENVVTPVVDYAVTRDEVDFEKIAFIGFSMGGFLGPRAACFEHRPKVYIANSGVWSMYEVAVNRLGEEMEKLLDTDPDTFNIHIKKAMEKSMGIAWGVRDAIWKYKLENPASAFIEMRKYSQTKENVEKIKSHMLICDSDGEHMMGETQAQKIFNAIKGPKDYMKFTAEEAAEAHCQIGALAILYQKTFDWLDEFFN
jgi:esterase/lipase